MRLTFKEGSMASSNASLKSSDFDVECNGSIGCKAVFAIVIRMALEGYVIDYGGCGIN